MRCYSIFIHDVYVDLNIPYITYTHNWDTVVQTRSVSDKCMHQPVPLHHPGLDLVLYSDALLDGYKAHLVDYISQEYGFSVER